MVCVPVVDASKSIVPLDELMTTPELALKVPPVVPLMEGVGSVSSEQ